MERFLAQHQFANDPPKSGVREGDASTPLLKGLRFS
jgi:hypothetical protein